MPLPPLWAERTDATDHLAWRLRDFRRSIRVQDERATASSAPSIWDHSLRLCQQLRNATGNSEILCGEILKELPRDELILSSKAGYRNYSGPTAMVYRKIPGGQLRADLRRYGLEYFDIFYLAWPDRMLARRKSRRP